MRPQPESFVRCYLPIYNDDDGKWKGTPPCAEGTGYKPEEAYRVQGDEIKSEYNKMLFKLVPALVSN